MSTPEENNIIHTRPEPSEWPHLVHQGEALLTQARNSGQISMETANSALAIVENLDDAAIDHLRYYPLGQLACGLARHLVSEESRIHAIESISNIATRTWDGLRSKDPRGITLSTLEYIHDHIALEGPFLQPIQRASDSLPLAERLMADSLTVEAIRRKTKPDFDSLPSEDRKLWLNTHIPKIVRGTATAENTNREALDATMSLFVDTLAKKGLAEKSRTQKILIYRIPISEVISSQGIRELQLGRVATQFAILREDQFRSHSQDYLDIDSDGQPVFRKDKVPKHPPARMTATKAKDIVVLRDNIEKCPAFYAHDKRPDHRNLIPQVVDIALQGIADAQDAIEILIRERRYYGPWVARKKTDKK